MHSEHSAPIITKEEVINTVKLAKSNKAVGFDNILTEIIKLINDNICILTVQYHI